VADPHGHSPALVDPAQTDEKPSRAKPQRRRCDQCGKPMSVERFYQRFCSAKWRKAFHDAGNTAFGHVKHLYAKEHRALLLRISELEVMVARIERQVIGDASVPYVWELHT
jgi:ribosomal protein S14